MTIVHGPYCDAEYRRDSCVCLDEADRREARERARHDYEEDRRERIGRAAGGSVWSNMPTIVGERGPELFVPRASGHIVPNSQILAGLDEEPNPEGDPSRNGAFG